MAEFKCYECNGRVVTGEKFTFTKKGAVHSSCFLSARRKEIGKEKEDELMVLSTLLDHQLTYLLNLLNLKTDNEKISQIIKEAYKNIEKDAGETTRVISSL